MRGKGVRKNYVIDTNVLLHDPSSILNFKGNNVILPLVVLEELDSLKSREGLAGCQARQASRKLSAIIGSNEHRSLKSGIELENGILLRVETNGYHSVPGAPEELSIERNDNRILLTALALLRNDPGTPTILVTKDINMRIKAASLDIPAEDYETDKVPGDSLYRGYVEEAFSEKEVAHIFNGGLPCPKRLSLLPNQFVTGPVKGNGDEQVTARMRSGMLVPLEYEHGEAWGLKPINAEQKMAFELLMDDSVQFVSITGGAGSGKTILSTAVALEKVVEQRRYRKMVFVRPVVAAGEDIGYLPGSEEEKLRPWMGSFYDAIENLAHLGASKKSRKRPAEEDFSVDAFIEGLRRAGMLEMKTFTYMRGRTFSDSFVIIDEAQEMTPHIAKLMLTRAGQNSKFVFLGDPTDNQIDNIMVDAKSNGLVYIAERMKGHEITGHVTLRLVERSNLAKIAESVL